MCVRVPEREGVCVCVVKSFFAVRRNRTIFLKITSSKEYIINGKFIKLHWV